MDVNSLDLKKLRKDLDDYFTSAYFMVSKFALMDMVDVQTASNEKLIEIAKKNKFDLNKYKLKEEKKLISKSNNSKKDDWFKNPLI